MRLHRGRLIDHVQLVVADLARSQAFYEAVLNVIGVPVVGGEDFFYADELFVSTGEPRTGRCHLAFQTRSTATVDAFHAAGLAAGGTDNGAPGLRPYHAGYYAAFLLDPDGNNIEAVFHGPADYSATSVTIDFPG